MHLFDADQRFYGGNAIVGGGIPVAVGLALAEKIAGRDRVTVCVFGEGAIAEGEFHESMNLAALWDVPVLFCAENNLYAMGTALSRSESETNLSVKAASYEMPAWSVDGMDVLAVAEAARLAVGAIRGGSGPHFLEMKTYRFRAHSMFDPELYRSKEEVSAWMERDPIERFTEKMAGVITSEDTTGIEEEVDAEIADAVEFAEQGSLEAIDDLTRFVYSEVPG